MQNQITAILSDYDGTLCPTNLVRSNDAAMYLVRSISMSYKQEVPGKLTEAQNPSAGCIYHTYSSYARDIDMLNTTYHYLDLVPKGRDELDHEFPQFWVRRRDEYSK